MGKIGDYMKSRKVEGDNDGNTFLSRCKAVMDKDDGGKKVSAKLAELVGGLKTQMDSAAAGQRAPGKCVGHQWNSIDIPKSDSRTALLEHSSYSKKKLAKLF